MLYSHLQIESSYSIACKMSSTQTIELEPVRSLETPHPPSSKDVAPVAPLGDVLGRTVLPDDLHPAPMVQRVFEQESFSAMGKSRKIAILVLIVGCNFVQARSSILPETD